MPLSSYTVRMVFLLFLKADTKSMKRPRCMQICSLTPHFSKAQRSSDVLLDLLLKLCSSLPPHSCRIDIGRRFVVRLGKHAHNTDEDLFHALDRAPAFGGVFVVVGVVARRVQDRDADNTIRIH